MNAQAGTFAAGAKVCADIIITKAATNYLAGSDKNDDILGVDV